MRAAEPSPELSQQDEVTREIRHGLLWALGLRLAEEEGAAAWTRGGRWAAARFPAESGEDVRESAVPTAEDDVRLAAA